MSTEASRVVGDDAEKEDQTRECPECGGEMSMNRVIRTGGPSGMFWVCDDHRCGASVTKSGARAEDLELS